MSVSSGGGGKGEGVVVVAGGASLRFKHSNGDIFLKNFLI